MSWQDRLKPATYTPNNGVALPFLYEDVSHTFNKKTSAFEFPDTQNTYVQDLGHTGRRFPLRVIISGGNYDIAAAEFENALRVRGVGLLSHPMYGDVQVIPFGEIKRMDKLKTAGNQAIIEVTFWETTGIVFPNSQQDSVALIETAIDDGNNFSALALADVINLQDTATKSAMRNQFAAFKERTRNVLRAIADTQDDVNRQFNAINDSIDNSLNLFFQQPLDLAFQGRQLVQTPGRALTSIKARLSAYRGLLEDIIVGVDGDSRILPTATGFHSADLWATANVSGSVVSALNNTFDTRTEALETAEEILLQFADLSKWRDDSYTALAKDPAVAKAEAAAAEAIATAAAIDAAANPGDAEKQAFAVQTDAAAQSAADAALAAASVTTPEVDTGEVYQQLLRSVALVAGFLVDSAFGLRQEYRITLTIPHTIIDLAAELYGKVDDEELNFIINTNDLTGSEILELPRGREIVFFV